jgi:hypothetical protein
MNDTALVLTPYSWGSAAVELANKTWRKRILPIGDVAYQGRTLHFTEDYLSKLAEAFRSGAYDQVSFQLADAKNTHTNDPERHRGTIVDLQLEHDGLYALAQVTDAGERILSENPYLGVSARIVENYARSDGKFYPAAIQHVLGTLDPRIPALGAWSPVDMANGGELVVDLSHSAWLGEPGPSYDLAASAVGARLSVSSGDANSDAYMDAVIQATMPSGYADYDTTGLAEFSNTFELANETELIRQAEDAEPLAVKSEDRIARAMERIEAGTYTPRGAAAYGFAQGSTTGTETCGSADEYGYCRERFHAAGCGSAATPDVVEVLRPAMADLAQRPLLDADGNPWIDARFGSPMTATDFVESATGIRLGDASLWEAHRGQRRELVSPARPQVFGDPDDPDAMPLAVPAGTARTAALLAAQSGIQTTADHQAQHAAAVREHQRQAARIKPPRHADYAEFSNPVHRGSGPVPFGDAPWNGSLQVLTLAGSA